MKGHNQERGNDKGHGHGNDKRNGHDNGNRK